jgi:hypothetical protein
MQHKVEPDPETDITGSATMVIPGKIVTESLLKSSKSKEAKHSDEENAPEPVVEERKIDQAEAKARKEKEGELE